MKTKIEIIDIIAKSYTSDTRAVIDGASGACKYLTGSGLKCGVGMFLTEDAVKVAEGCMGNVGSLQVHLQTRGFEDLDSAFIKEVRGHGFNFWGEMQGLHDYGSNWDSEGLSIEGKEEADLLRRKYA
jgi:hypothetical protein